MPKFMAKLGWFKDDENEDDADDNDENEDETDDNDDLMMVMTITGRIQGVFDSGQSGASMGRKWHSTWSFIHK